MRIILEKRIRSLILTNKLFTNLLSESKKIIILDENSASLKINNDD